MTLAEFLADIPVAHTIILEPAAGTAGYGDVFGPPVTVTPVYVEQERRLVTAPDGSQVVSGTTVWVEVDLAVPDRSRITLPDGQVTKVITVAKFSGGGADVPEHQQIACE